MADRTVIPPRKRGGNTLLLRARRISTLFTRPAVELVGIPPILFPESSLTLWFVEHLLSFTEESRSCTLFAAARPCIVQDSHNFSRVWQHKVKAYPVPTGSMLSFSRVDRSMRKVSVIRDYSQEDTGRTLSSGIHSSSIENGDPFFALSRDTGFPPRQG